MLQKKLWISLFLIAELPCAIEIMVFKTHEMRYFEHHIVEGRQKEFSQFPYLMDQGEEFEELYAQCYTQASNGALAVAFNNDGDVIGFLTGMSLREFDNEWLPYGCEQISEKLQGKLDPEKNYYLGDVIVSQEYRGQKIADKLFDALEKHAESKKFETASFITVIREDNHPQKPVHYKSPVAVWERLGYKKSERIVTYNWPTRQTDNPKVFKPEDNPCDIWIKVLGRQKKCE